MYPITKATKTYLDAGSDSPALARIELAAGIDTLNSVIDAYNSGVNVDAYGGLAAAVASPETAGKTLYVTTAQSLSADLNTTGRLLVIRKGSIITIGSGKTLTFDTQPLIGVYQAFAGSGAVAGLTQSRPEWWPGGTTAAAFKAAVDGLATGGVVLLQATTYQSPYNTDANKLRKGSISFVGARMPSVNSGATALENGTIIQGKFDVFAHNVSIRDLGIDAGTTVCAALNGGVATDAFVIGSDGTAPPPWLGLRAENICCLCQSPTVAYHAFLCEDVDRAFLKNIRTKYGTHGIVFKATYTTATGLYAEDHASDGLIIKADNYGASTGSEYSNIVITSTAPGRSGGIMIMGDNAHATHINITNAFVVGASYGVQVNGNGTYYAADISLVNVNVGNVTGIGFYFNGASQCVTVVNGVANSGTSHGFVADTGSKNITLVNCRARSNIGNGFDMRGTNGNVVNPISQDNGGFGLYATGAQQCDTFANVSGNGSGSVGFGAGGKFTSSSAPATPSTPTFANSWHNYGGGNPDAKYWLDQGRVRLGGLIAGGSLATDIFTLPTGYRPAAGRRFAVLCWNGSANVIGELAILSTGAVRLNYGATTYVSLDGIEFSLACD